MKVALSLAWGKCFFVAKKGEEMAVSPRTKQRFTVTVKCTKQHASVVLRLMNRYRLENYPTHSESSEVITLRAVFEEPGEFSKALGNWALKKGLQTHREIFPISIDRGALVPEKETDESQLATV